MAIVFTNPGVMPIEALTIMGASSKPSTDSPIGHFGTGLKYALAVLMRFGATVIICSGDKQLTFKITKTDFRADVLETVVMKVTQGSKRYFTRLPFTLNYGENWELWMAYRELASNCIDEKGTRTQINDEDIGNVLKDVGGDDVSTSIIVCLEEFDEVHESGLGEVFMPDTELLIADTACSSRYMAGGLEVRQGATDYIYSKGLRVFELDKPAMYTYNYVDGVLLTEDRTLANIYALESHIRHTVISDDKIKLDCLQAADITFEHSLSWDNMDPKEVFADIEEYKRLSKALGYGLEHGDMDPGDGVFVGSGRVGTLFAGYVTAESSAESRTKIKAMLQNHLDGTKKLNPDQLNYLVGLHEERVHVDYDGVLGQDNLKVLIELA